MTTVNAWMHASWSSSMMMTCETRNYKTMREGLEIKSPSGVRECHLEMAFVLNDPASSQSRIWNTRWWWCENITRYSSWRRTDCQEEVLSSRVKRPLVTVVVSVSQFLRFLFSMSNDRERSDERTTKWQTREKKWFSKTNGQSRRISPEPFVNNKTCSKSRNVVSSKVYPWFLFDCLIIMCLFSS